MNDLNLSEQNIEDICRSYASLRDVPDFSVSTDTDVNVMFFKRKDKYSGIRTGLISDFTSREEFLVYSFLVEGINAHTKNKLTLEHLKVESFSSSGFENIYEKYKSSHEQFPSISDVVRSYSIANNSDISWVFLETNTNYHSVFWCESESRLFRKSA